MKMDEQIRLPGPTAVPPQCLRAQSRQVIGHREVEFSKLLVDITRNLKKVFETEGNPLIFPASGTGGLEIAVVNTISRGDKVLSINNGVFGQRFRDIARTFGAEIIELAFPWGQGCDYDEIKRVLDSNTDIKAVLFTHNETSTGVQNDLAGTAEIVRDHDAILLVDAVSSLGGMPVKTDDYNLDIVISSSQKALMTPPGLAVISVSPEAWERIEASSTPRFYWDLMRSRKYYDERQQTPYTPSISLLYALDTALKSMLKEGLKKIYRRHQIFTKALRDGLAELGFEPFVPREIASYTVSAFYQAEFIEFPLFKEHLLKHYKLHFAAGQQQLRNKIFRIGHMGYINKNDIIKIVEIFARGLADFNVEVDIESALAICNKALRGVEENV